jgi:integrase
MPRLADRKKITKSLVDSITPPGPGEAQDRIIWDSEVPGFGLRVRGDYPPVYVIRYRHNGHNRRMTINTVGAVTPAQARQEALRVLGDKTKGLDPLRERANEKRRQVTVKELGERYLAQHAEVHKKPQSAHHDKLTLAKHVYPAFGGLEVHEVTRRHIADWHHRHLKKPGAANRVLALLSKMFSCAVLWGLREDNPVRGVPRYKENKRTRFLSDAELARLGKVLREAEQNETEYPSIVALFRLLVLTGCRAGELTNLKWPQVDFQSGAITILDGKTGDRILPMNPPTRVILAQLYAQRAESPWVIKGRKTNHPLISYNRPWERVVEAAKLENVRVHDLRHSNASVGAAAGLSLPIIGALLGHASPVTTSRYAHLSNDPIRKASDLIGARIAAAMEQEVADEDEPVNAESAG